MTWRHGLGIFSLTLISSLIANVCLTQGTALNFVGIAAEWYPADGNTLVETSQKPYGANSDYVVTGSSTTVSVDDAAGTISGNITLLATGSFFSTESSDVTCQQSITETTTFSGTFTPSAYELGRNTFEEFANGKSTFTRTVVTSGITPDTDYNTVFGIPDTSWCQTGWTSEGVWYALHNDGYDVANTTSFAQNTNDYVSIYTDVPYTIVGRAWLDKPVPDLTVSNIEVVQVIQDAAKSIQLVAQKSAMARVYLKIGSGPLEPIASVSAKLHGYRSGKELTGSPLSPLNATITAPNVPQRADLNQSLNFELPLDWTSDGTLQLTAEIIPPATITENADNNLTEQSFVFTPRQELDIAYITVCVPAATPGQPDICPSNAIKTAHQFLNKIYPVADKGVDYYPLPVNNWVWSKPLYSTQDFYELMAALRQRYDLTDNIEGVVPDQLVAWLPGINGGPLLGISDPLWGGKENAAGRVTINLDSSAMSLPSCTGAANVVDPLDLQMTLAHEVGHNLGLHHTNTPDSCKSEDPNTPWPYATGTIQELGMDVQTKQLVPATKYDTMTYQSPPTSNIWISPFHYTQLYTGKLDPQNTSNSQAGTAARYLVLSGIADRTGSTGNITSSYIVNSHTGSVAPDPTGNYCVKIEDTTGDVTPYCFTLTFIDSEHNTILEYEPFSLKIPLAETVASRVILATASGTALDVMDATTSSPQVQFTDLTTGSTITDNTTVSWTASDADGDALQYVVRYSPDSGATWLPLVTNVSYPSFNLATTGLTSSDTAYFEVLASDGVQTARHEIGPLTVAAETTEADDEPLVDIDGDYDTWTSNSNADSNNNQDFVIGGLIVLGIVLTIGFIIIGIIAAIYLKRK